MIRLPSSLSISPDPALEICIREMQFGDLHAVSEIDQLSFSAPWPKNSFRSELENPASLCRVAEALFAGGAKQIVGAMVTWIIVDEAHISTLAVHPAYRRQGIARRMMLDTLGICSRKGVLTATLEVRAGNIPAQNLYRGFGFHIVAVQSGYYSDNHEDAYIMTLERLDAGALLRNSTTQQNGKTI